MGRGSALDIAALRPSTRPVSSASYTSAVPPRPIFLLHDVCKAKLQSCCTYLLTTDRRLCPLSRRSLSHRSRLNLPDHDPAK